MKKITFLLVFGIFLKEYASAIPSFPGAEGYGSYATGGRDGKVIHVTHLGATGPGSLQEACSTEGPRTVVFDVGGIIEGDILIEHGDLTIAGESAPGPGITIKGKFWTDYEYGIDNIVVRFLRIRPTDLSGDQGDAIQFSRSKNFILDHVSVAWGSDETIDIYEATDATIQWCTIEASATHAGHPDGDFHNYGLINGPDGGRISVHHNLFAHHRRRSPAIANGPSDIRNNVIYNFREAVGLDNPSNLGGLNAVGNYFKKGPSEDNPVTFNLRDDSGYSIPTHLHDVYLDYPPEIERAIENPWLDDFTVNKYGETLGSRSDIAFNTPPITLQSSIKAYETVLDIAGSFPRDIVTRTTIDEVRNRTGEWGRKVPQDLLEGISYIAVIREDTDRDGIPDHREIEFGLNPTIADSHLKTLSEEGYTNLEVYLHDQASRLTNGKFPLKPSDLVEYPSGLIPLFRYKVSGYSVPHHFYTSVQEEIQYINHYLWNHFQYEGVSQLVLAGPVEGSVPVYRVRIAYWDYFYTTSIDEAKYLSELINGFGSIGAIEGIAFFAYPGPIHNAKPVYRFFSNANRTYFYTISEEEKDWIIANVLPGQLDYEGIAWWAY